MNLPFNLKTANVDGQPEDKPKEKPVYIDIQDLDKLDLSSELLKSYNNAARLFTMIEHDEEVGANQKAQVLNTIRGIQEQILRNQERSYNVNKLKVIENTLIEVLKTFPELKEAFLLAYEKAAKAHADQEKRAANA